MPLYDFKCPSGHSFEAFASIADRDVPVPCEMCKRLADRDVMASMGTHTDMVEREEISEAMGINPSQIAEVKARFPHHNFTPDGAMVFRNRAEKKRVLKDLGYRDYSSYYE